MNALEKWHKRPLQVRVLDRCDECGELKEGVRKQVSLWPNMTAVCCAECFAEMTTECSGFAVCQWPAMTAMRSSRSSPQED
ncbi:hypothetical protein PQR53_12525 [Paraburkholderia fungorum]|uniref:hypothetical protein n=1 Tax=Paraburkholderia fungorum TaxID=134537 RepID=UPI0038BC7772